MHEANELPPDWVSLYGDIAPLVAEKLYLKLAPPPDAHQAAAPTNFDDYDGLDEAANVLSKPFSAEPDPKRARREHTPPESVAASLVNPDAALLLGRAPTGHMETREEAPAALALPGLSFVDRETFRELDNNLKSSIIGCVQELGRINFQQQQLAASLEETKMKNAAERERIQADVLTSTQRANNEEARIKAERDVELERLAIEKLRLNQGVAKLEAQARLEEARAQRQRQPVAAAAPSHAKAAVSLRRLVDSALLPIEAARAFARKLPFGRVPLDWAPSARRLTRAQQSPRDALSAPMTLDVVFRTGAPLAEVAAAVQSAVAEELAPAPEPAATDAPETQPAADAMSATVSLNVTTDNRQTGKGIAVTNNIHTLLAPKPARDFLLAPKAARKLPLMRILAAGQEAAAPEWKEPYYPVWLGRDLKQDLALPSETLGESRVYDPQHFDAIRAYERTWRATTWPSRRGVRPPGLRV